MRPIPRFFLVLSVTLTAGCASWSTDGGDELGEMETATSRPALPSGGAKRGEFPSVRFADLSWSLSAEESRRLRETAKALKGRTETVILTGGASASPPEYARQLGQLRAEEVRQALLDHGVPEERMITTGFGQDLTGRGGSDRVEISLAPTPVKAPKP